MSTTNEPTPADRPASPPPHRPPAGQRGQQRPRLRLADASAGLVREPLSLLLYGVEGVGKTSFAASAPSPIILGAENGSAEIGNVQRLSPTSLDDVLSVLDELRTAEHAYRTVVVDSLDWMEPLVWAATCARGNKATIEAFGYGKGYVEALTEWRTILRYLDAIRARGHHVILIAHSHVKAWKNPAGEDYDRYTLKLHEKAAGLWKEWAKAVLFANFERATVEANGRQKGIDTGRRVLYTRASAAYDAKNRLWLPAEIALGWGPFARAVKAGAELRGRWYEALDKAGPDKAASAREHVEQNNYDPAIVEETIKGLAAA